MKLNAKRIKRNLKKAISNVAANPESYSLNPSRDFTRKRKLPLSEMLYSVLSMGGKDLKNEMMNFFDFSASMPTVSAFVQQRKKISSRAFEAIFKDFTQSCYTPSLYKGYRLLAVDGSDLHIPTNKEENLSYYPGANGQKPYNLLHLNCLYDLGQHIYTDAVIQRSRQGNEHKAFVTMVDRDYCPAPTIYMADRGYEAYNNLAHIQEKGQCFLIRIKEACRNGIATGLNLPKTEEFDVSYHRILTRRQTKEAKENKNLFFVPSNLTFDYLPSKSRKHDPLMTYTLHYRIVRLKISEDTYEMLITNLSPEEFPPEELKKLYAMRWGIETSFRALKYTLGLVYFHSKKTESIYQEIFAKLTMYNFAEFTISNIAVKQKQRKHPYKANFSAAVHICSNYLLKNISPSVVEELISRHLVPVKPSKTFRRQITQKTSVYFHYRIA